METMTNIKTIRLALITVRKRNGEEVRNWKCRSGKDFENALKDSLNSNGFRYFCTFNWANGARKVAYYSTPKLRAFLAINGVDFEMVTDRYKN